MLNLATLGSVDPGSDRAAFRQIADQLRAAIERRDLQENEQLPSEAQLIEHYGVARMTVRNALQQLQTEGLTVARHGKGVYVRPRPPVRRLAADRFARRHREAGKAAFIAEADKLGARPTVDMIRISEEEPPRGIAERLRLASGELALVRRRRYMLDGRPVETATSYLPLAVTRGTAIERENPGPGGIYARLEDAGHTLDHFEEEVSARMPLPDEVRTLNLLPAVPVIHLVRTAFTADGLPVEVCDTIMASDSYVLSYDLRAD